MALNLLGSGYATLEYEIAQGEGVGARSAWTAAGGRAGGTCRMPADAHSDQKIRDHLVEQAGYALWLLAVQREACGLNNLAHVMQVYRVPNEVYGRMGPLSTRAIHSAETMAG